VSSDRQPFPFAGMLPQLKCLGVVLARSLQLAESEVGAAHRCIRRRKIRIKLDGALVVRNVSARCRMRIVLPAMSALIVFICAIAAPSQTSDLAETEIRSVMAEARKASLEGDSAKIAALMTDDYLQ